MFRLSSPAASSDAAKRKAAAESGGAAAKKRGSYNCGRCGLPKKGHVCMSAGSPVPADAPRLRRALSFDDDRDIPPSQANEIRLYQPSSDMPADDEDVEDEMVDGLDSGVLPARLLAEVLSRLPPRDLMAAAGVCKGWKDSAGRIWRSAEELRIRVPRMSQVSFVGSVLQKCSSLLRLSLHMESDINATVLACIAFSCPILEALEITIRDAAVNRITGDALGRFVTEKRSLSSLKIEGCSNLGFLNLSSSSLQVLWLSDLHSLSRSIINCPNLSEISLDFSRQGTDSTDLTSMMENLSRSCPKLRNIHIASTRLSNPAVLALTGGKLRDLRMLSLVLGSKITDAAVASIVASFKNLDLLDLSGSSISDSGIGMICNVYPDSLSRLLLALCPNITSSGIQFATAQLPRLQLIDCGMSMCHVSPQDGVTQTSQLQHDGDDFSLISDKSTRRFQSIYQKLIVKHGQLRKLSLWGCSSLDALHLNCPQLVDLNLNSCTNLHPERLDLQCPNLEVVHASGCKNILLKSLTFQDEVKSTISLCLIYQLNFLLYHLISETIFRSLLVLGTKQVHSLASAWGTAPKESMPPNSSARKDRLLLNDVQYWLTELTSSVDFGSLPFLLKLTIDYGIMLTSYSPIMLLLSMILFLSGTVIKGSALTFNL